MFYTKKLRRKKQDNETEKKKNYEHSCEKFTFKCIKAVWWNIFTESANDFYSFLQVNYFMILLQLDVLLTFKMLTWKIFSNYWNDIKKI